MKAWVSMDLKSILPVFLLVLAVSLYSQQKELVIDAESTSSSSPVQWVFSDVQTSKGPVSGLEISLDPKGTATQADLLLGFDDAAFSDSEGKWLISAEGTVSSALGDQARFGSGAAQFKAPLGKLSLQPSKSSIFALPIPIGDFSIDFWLKPTRAENGEIIFIWKASRQNAKIWVPQQASCLIVKNRISFGFLNFFMNPSGKDTSVSLQGKSLLVPGRWSHHSLRFDSENGMLEYLMDGVPEAVTFVTSTGREGDTVFPLLVGPSSRLDLGSNYTGLMDDFRLSPAFLEDSAGAKYRKAGGSAVSPIFDLGYTNSQMLRIELTSRVRAESAIQCFYRLSDFTDSRSEADKDWIPFIPGKPMDKAAGRIFGRYIQFKFLLYPDASGEISPVLTNVSVLYEPDYPPQAPGSIAALGGNGRVLLRWSALTEDDIRGYVVYYGTGSGNYYGTDALEGSSPLSIKDPHQLSIALNGLTNGVLYYFAVVAIDAADPPHAGEFSREVNARPSRVSP